MLDADICARALGARDPRFDGLFFVGITSTRVYCRPVCPARVSYPDRRRFFESPAAAEGAGFRPCLRCRPELAPGRALIDAIPRLAHVAAHRIAAGALNEHTVGQLAHDLGVSERHLRRALEREVGVSPLELAQTHRLLLAKRLLADTSLSVTRVAYASGFQSLRRFNAVFRERYRMSPTALRRRPAKHSDSTPHADSDRDTRPLRLTLAYRPPLAWTALLHSLRRDALPGVESVDAREYRRTVRIGSRAGTVTVRSRSPNATPSRHSNLIVELSPELLPALMPLLARLRHLFDLDAEPTVIDAHLEQGGLGSLVRSMPGMRLPGAFDGFDVAFGILVRDGSSPFDEPTRRVIQALGDAFDGGDDALTHFAPDTARVRDVGECELVSLGVQAARAAAIITIAELLDDGSIRLEPGSDADATHRILAAIDGVGERLATEIVARTLQWPDAYASCDPSLHRALDVSSDREAITRAEPWRPWRAYAALHLTRRANRVRHALA